MSEEELINNRWSMRFADKSLGYVVVCGESPEFSPYPDKSGIEWRVNQMIELGWAISGSLAIDNEMNPRAFYQPMVRSSTND